MYAHQLRRILDLSVFCSRQGLDPEISIFECDGSDRRMWTVALGVYSKGNLLDCVSVEVHSTDIGQLVSDISRLVEPRFNRGG